MANMATIVAEALAERRREQGLSQRELARTAGVTRQAIGAIESGRVQPGVGIALALARALSASVEDLFGSAGPSPLAATPARATGERRRAAASLFDGRVVVRSLDAYEAQLAEPAGALVTPSAGDHAQIEPLADRRSLAATVFVSGCEPSLGLLAGHVNASGGHAVWFATSNRDALAEFVERRAHAAALHGSELEVGRLVRKLGADVRFYELASTEEGWVVARDNPLKLRGARDLKKPSVRLANRPRGATARALVDSELRRAGIAARSLSGYERTLAGHADVARAIAFGYADIGLAVAGVAQAFDLGFIPLRAERCVLAIHSSDLTHPGVVALLRALGSTSFRRDLGAFGPYDVTRLGERWS